PLKGRRRDGEEFPVEMALNPVVTAEEEFLMASIIDVTTRRHTEESIQRLNSELRASQERFALAVRGSRDGIWDWDHQAERLWLSDGALEQFGLDGTSETRPLLDEVVSRIHPEDRESTLAVLRAHLAGHGRFDVEARVTTGNREYRWFRFRGEAVLDDQGTLL